METKRPIDTFVRFLSKDEVRFGRRGQLVHEDHVIREDVVRDVVLEHAGYLFSQRANRGPASSVKAGFLVPFRTCAFLSGGQASQTSGTRTRRIPTTPARVPLPSKTARSSSDEVRDADARRHLRAFRRRDPL